MSSDSKENHLHVGETTQCHGHPEEIPCTTNGGSEDVSAITASEEPDKFAHIEPSRDDKKQSNLAQDFEQNVPLNVSCNKFSPPVENSNVSKIAETSFPHDWDETATEQLVDSILLEAVGVPSPVSPLSSHDNDDGL
ncbi:uncharacterized protein LOC126299120 isoform X2 [Schistocerca gregaria]|uniref:uncharacterized protein LOC126299120 isoform X2 n=1 Tax=Schistocerca gregaria TaxID=7010 RepID=UPI00211E88DD|nr:uncharacterized protein LOC126299120 isoform X2 [Schistocerca gregaria]XP_049846778.1 uncharacterized protein LOC126299120 isoform X2 [Schistocerca gregaria]